MKRHDMNIRTMLVLIVLGYVAAGLVAGMIAEWTGNYIGHGGNWHYDLLAVALLVAIPWGASYVTGLRWIWLTRKGERILTDLLLVLIAACAIYRYLAS